MAFAGPKKWRFARYPSPPGKLIVLGSVIEEPEDPHTFLIRPSEVVPIQDKDVYDLSDVVKTSIRSQLESGSDVSVKALIPIFPHFSAGLSGKAGVARAIDIGVDALNVRAKLFKPTDSEKEYMSAVLQKPEVTEFLQRCFFSKSLYMIVGVATTHKLDRQEGGMRGHDTTVSANASAPPAGVEMAASVSHGAMSTAGVSTSVDGDMDFAYSVREFSYSKMRKRVGKGRDWNKGALFSADQEDDACPEEEEFVPEFEGFEDEDVDGGETGFTIIP